MARQHSAKVNSTKGSIVFDDLPDSREYDEVAQAYKGMKRCQTRIKMLERSTSRKKKGKAGCRKTDDQKNGLVSVWTAAKIAEIYG